MNAYLNQIIQTFKDSHPQRALEDVQDEEIRYLHEEYETELHECVRCDRLYEAERDLDGWFDSQYCEECYWDLNGEGRD
jgi:isoleucyl-tRNA synthetase